MDTSQLAKRFHVSRSTAQKWCRDGRVIGAMKNRRGSYDIPDNPVLRYQVKQKRNRTAYDVYVDIVKACNRNELATPQDLGCTIEQFSAYTQSLVAEGLLKALSAQDSVQEQTTLDFVVTFKGCELAQKNKTEAISFLKQMVLKISF